MSFYISGFEADLSLEIGNVERFLEEYKSINSMLDFDQNRYDRILLNYGTEKLKIATSLLTTILTDIERKGLSAVNYVFELLQSEGETDLAVFLANRIFEKHSSCEIEDLLIRTQTYSKVLSILIQKKDIYFFTYYLLGYLKELKRFLRDYRYLVEDVYRSATMFNQYMYIYYMTVIDDREKALGYLIKDIDLREFLFRKGILSFPEFNNLFHIINLAGLYFQLEDSVIRLTIDLESYIKKLKDELLEINRFVKKHPDKKFFFLNPELKKYLNEFLANIYVSGFEDYYMEISEVFPELLTNDHKMIIKILEFYRRDNITTKEIENLREEIDRLFNNLSFEKKERVVYLFYNFLVDFYSEDSSKLVIIRKEIEDKVAKFPVMKIPLFRVLNFLGYSDKASKIAEEVKKELAISGRETLLKAVEKYIEEEF
ncbi:hypothetical protein [Persephonella sp.]